MKTGKFAMMALAALLLTAPRAMRTQTGDEAGQKNAQQARAALDAMVKALGGSAWLNIQNMEREGHIAAFFHGTPDLGTEETFEYH